ncbi:MAG: hypothetical protein GXC72_03480 [Chitinophagaceae bacterium]|nr:hypothetical protein [Chitinophagaceae bacterium]
MNSTENVKLINGVFTPDEAKEVLLTLLNHKINFHRMRNFSSEERLGEPDPASTKRLAELYKSREQVLALLDRVNTSGHKLVIESMVHIQLGEKMELAENPSSLPPQGEIKEQELIQLW